MMYLLDWYLLILHGFLTFCFSWFQSQKSTTEYRPQCFAAVFPSVPGRSRKGKVHFPSKACRLPPYIWQKWVLWGVVICPLLWINAVICSNGMFVFCFNLHRCGSLHHSLYFAFWTCISYPPTQSFWSRITGLLPHASLHLLTVFFLLYSVIDRQEYTENTWGQTAYTWELLRIIFCVPFLTYKFI